MSVSLRSPEQDAVDQELLALLARQGRRVPYPVAIVAAVIATMAWTGQESAWPLLWLGAVLGVLALRWWGLGRLAQQHQVSMTKRIRTASGLSLLNGLIFGASALFSPDFSEYQRMVHTLLVLGLCAGAVATTAGYAPVFLAFMVPVVLSTVLMWITHAGTHAGTWLDWALGFLILAFAGILYGLARDAYRVFSESLRIRFQQVQTNQRLTLALHQAESAMQARTRFLAAASHDLRQPMHTLSLFGAALSLQPLDAHSRAIAAQMNQALQMLASQMDALLDISKLDARVVPVNFEAIRLDTWLARFAGQWKADAARKGLAFQLVCPAHVFVESDPVLLERVVRNLVDNAIKYTHEGRIDVVVAPAEGVWNLQIIDTGCGIAAHEQSRIFEEFYQINNPERDRSKGLGLGLSIVARLVDMLDANLALASTPGRGSVFTLSLNEAEPFSDSEASRLGREAVDLRGLRVLVLDDEAPVREAMVALLTAYGCEVLVADTLRAAMIQLLQGKPDVALVDLRLRGGDDGFSAVRSLHNTAPSMPAILVSGDTAPERLHQAAEEGLTLLHKPVRPEELLRVIHNAVSSAARGLDEPNDPRQAAQG
jgi:signal transduction histidine kinase/ActR/RegA family two-component response regulator